MNPNFNRKGFLALTGGVSLAAFLAACGGGSDSGSSSAGGDAAATTAAAGAQSVFDPATEPGGPIEIFTWAGYDDTEGDGAPWMWADYEASEYGTESPLKFTFLEDDTQALAKVASGYSPDVMHPCVAWVPQWKAAGLIQPLDLSLLPDWDGIPTWADGYDDFNLWMSLDWGTRSPSSLLLAYRTPVMTWWKGQRIGAGSLVLVDEVYTCLNSPDGSRPGPIRSHPEDWGSAGSRQPKSLNSPLMSCANAAMPSVTDQIPFNRKLLIAMVRSMATI